MRNRRNIIPLIPLIILISIVVFHFLQSAGNQSEAAIPSAFIPDEVSLSTNIHTQSVKSTATNTEQPFDNVQGETVTPLVTPEVDSQPVQEGNWDEAIKQAGDLFIANTAEDAIKVVNDIGFVDGYSESPSNACGPLSIAILMEAGVLTDGVSVHDVWLLNLRGENSQLKLLEQRYFPPQTYDYFWINENIREYSFAEHPLQPGDWLFLFTAGNGFDHMLTVTRVSESGAAFSVTNIDRGEGFLIKEECLYDPENEGEHLFYELTDKVMRKELGLTGTAGFLLIRRIGGIESKPVLNQEIQLPDQDQVEWHVLIKDLIKDAILYESFPNQPFESTSLTNYIQTLLALKTLEMDGVLSQDLLTYDYAGNPVTQIFEDVLTKDDHAAKTLLLGLIRINQDKDNILSQWHVQPDQFSIKQTEAFSLMNILQSHYHDQFLPQGYQDYLQDILDKTHPEKSVLFQMLDSNFNSISCVNLNNQTTFVWGYAELCAFSKNGKDYALVLHFSKKDGSKISHEYIQSLLNDFSVEFLEGFGGIN